MENRNIPKIGIITLLALLVPALFINLGLPAITADEPTRALVAMEMMFKHDYLISTIVGEFYYKKPPLFNWILVVLYRLFNSPSEWVTRLAAVIPLLLFTYRLFVITKRHVNINTAWLTVFIQLTFGRMLYYDSMLGHIDILYAWLTFETFVVLYEGKQKTDWNLRTFLLFYLLHAAAFMLKGLPSLLFPVLTLAAMSWNQRDIKWLFSWQHLIGILAGLSFPVLFFVAYAQHNSLLGWVLQLWDQSKQRTVLDKTVWESIRHLFTFPLDHFMHFAPWSILVIYLFYKGNSTRIYNQPFIKYLFWVLVFNIPVYWASPGYYPRYLFMLYPIVFIALSFAYFETAEKKWFQWFVRSINIILIAALPIIIIKMDWMLWNYPFIICMLLLLVNLYCAIKFAEKNIWLLVSLMLITRLFFNWYIIPHRVATGNNDKNKNEAIHIAEMTKGKPLYLTYPGSSSEHYHYYYIERERNEILTYKQPDTNSYFIYWPGTIVGVTFDTIYKFDQDFENTTLYVVKFRTVPKELPMMDSKRFYPAFIPN